MQLHHSVARLLCPPRRAGGEIEEDGVEGLRGETGRSWLREADPPRRPEEADLGVHLALAYRPTES